MLPEGLPLNTAPASKSMAWRDLSDASVGISMIIPLGKSG